MNLIFIGSQPIGHDCLNEIIRLGINVKAVFTFNPDTHEVWKKSVEEIASKKNIPIYFPEDLTVEKIKELKPDIILVIGYRKIFSQEILDIPKFGVFGIHASLLPHLRGQAPLNWAIINGDKETGVTLFKMDKGIDTGDIVDQKKISINIDDVIIDIKEKIKNMSVELISENILKIINNNCKFKKQMKNGTYGSARIPDDGLINWKLKTKKIHNLIRASEPSYPAFTKLNSKKIYIIKSELLDESDRYYGTPGQVGMTFKDGSVIIITKDGALRINTIRLENEENKDAKEYLNSSKIRLG